MEHVKQYFADIGASHLCDRIRVFDKSSATVSLAAACLNCEPAHIAKSICLDVSNSPINKKKKANQNKMPQPSESSADREAKSHNEMDAAAAQLTISPSTAPGDTHRSALHAICPNQNDSDGSAESKYVPIIIVMAGDTRINKKEFRKKFMTQPSMIAFDDVSGVVGFAPGGVCPFAVRPNVHVYLDVSLKRFEKVYAACGTANTAIGLSAEELERYACNFVEWVNVGEGWQPKA